MLDVADYNHPPRQMPLRMSCMTNLFTQFYFLSSRLQIIIPVRPQCEMWECKHESCAGGCWWPVAATCGLPWPNVGTQFLPCEARPQLRVMWVTGYLLYCWLYVDVVYVVDTTRLWDLHWTIPLWLTARCPLFTAQLSSAPGFWADWRRICVRAQSAQCWPGPAAGDVPRRSHFHFPRDPPAAAGRWLQDPGHHLTDQTLTSPVRAWVWNDDQQWDGFWCPRLGAGAVCRGGGCQVNWANHWVL